MQGHNMFGQHTIHFLLKNEQHSANFYGLSDHPQLTLSFPISHQKFSLLSAIQILTLVRKFGIVSTTNPLTVIFFIFITFLLNNVLIL